MNTPAHDDSERSRDSALSKTLRTWQIEPSLPPGFTREVHRRIAETNRGRAASGFARWLATLVETVAVLGRPAFATTYVALGIVLGAVSGSRYSQPDTSGSSRAELHSRYVASIDPYQMPRARTTGVQP
ncbi:MAG: hypothetical protein JNL97_00415 [Verrucomicrobiales bacterium]|nr:hypothetical protein [Verrucomicrobiales bacterium]